MSDELADLLAVPREETIGSGQRARTLQLTPFLFEELHLVAAIGKPLIDLLVGGNLQNPAAMLQLHGPTVVSLCAVLSRQDREWVAKLPAGQTIKLFNAVLEVNSDFFTDGLSGLIEMLQLFGWLPTKSSSPLPSPSPAAPAANAAASDPGSDSPTN